MQNYDRNCICLQFMKKSLNIIKKEKKNCLKKIDEKSLHSNINLKKN